MWNGLSGISLTWQEFLRKPCRCGLDNTRGSRTLQPWDQVQFWAAFFFFLLPSFFLSNTDALQMESLLFNKVQQTQPWSTSLCYWTQFNAAMKKNTRVSGLLVLFQFSFIVLLENYGRNIIPFFLLKKTTDWRQSMPAMPFPYSSVED